MIALLPIFLAAYPGPAAPPCLAVDGDRILIGDLAKAVPSFQALDPTQSAGFAPMPGARRIVLPRELFSIAKARGITLENPKPLCIERAAATLLPSQLQAALRHSLGEGITIEITDFSRYPVPPGEVQFPIAGLNFPPVGNAGTPVLWLGHVLYDGSRHLPVWVRVRLTATRTVLAAVVPIITGKVIEAAQVRTERRVMFPFPDVRPVSPEQAIGRIVCRSVAAGMVISGDMLTNPPDVDRGESVAVRVEDGGARLQFMATSEASGRIGDSVVVENPTTHFRFRGVVYAPHQVLVRSGGAY